MRELGRGAAWARLRGADAARTRRAGWSTRSTTSARPRGIDAVGFDWYDPVASHALRVPGRRTPDGRAGLVLRAGLLGRRVAPGGAARWCVTESALRPGLPLWVVENGMATRVRDGRAGRREDGMDRPRYVREHLGAVADAVAAGVPGARLLALVAGRQLRVGHLRAPLRPLRRGPPRPGAVRWLDTDAAGDDAAGEFARVVAGLRAGDRSVLDRPA